MAAGQDSQQGDSQLPSAEIRINKKGRFRYMPKEVVYLSHLVKSPCKLLVRQPDGSWRWDTYDNGTVSTTFQVFDESPGIEHYDICEVIIKVPMTATGRSSMISDECAGFVLDNDDGGTWTIDRHELFDILRKLQFPFRQHLVKI